MEEGDLTCVDSWVRVHHLPDEEMTPGRTKARKT